MQEAPKAAVLDNPLALLRRSVHSEAELSGSSAVGDAIEALSEDRLFGPGYGQGQQDDHQDRQDGRCLC